MGSRDLGADEAFARAEEMVRVWLAEPARPGDRGRAGADHQRLEWVPLDPPDRLRRLPWLEADLPIIDALVTALGR